MPLIKTENIAELKGKSPVLGVDYGTKNVGLAISDESWLIASPFKVINNTSFTKVAEQFYQIIDENNIELVVIGLPLRYDEGISKMEQRAKQFGRNLQKNREVNIYFHDEAFTSIDAKHSMIQSGIGRNKRKQKIDKIAASLMLQSFLDGC